MSTPWEVREEWVKSPPADWLTRLRVVSPIVDRTSHLGFRWRPKLQPEFHDTWELYELTPAALLTPERVQQLSQHWSELPPSQQYARKRFVTEYQHYMFRTHRVEARRFWVLQGETGGTPAEFTERETKLLESVNAPSDAPPVGMFAPCPFDQRAVDAIMARDNLRKVGGDLDALLKSRTAEALTAEDEANEKAYRKAFLGWWFEQMLPCSDFMKTFLRTKEASHALRRATAPEASIVTQWRDHFIETGIVLNTTSAPSTKIQIAVA